jgi:hypothetical protein
VRGGVTWKKRFVNGFKKPLSYGVYQCKPSSRRRTGSTKKNSVDGGPEFTLAEVGAAMRDFHRLSK